MVTYVFPGQGSQSVGMGKDLFAEFPEIVQKANQILGYSISDLCLQGGENLNKTNYTQPVQWTQSIEYLTQKGETTFEEVGPGTVLMGLIRRIQKGQ